MALDMQVLHSGVNSQILQSLPELDQFQTYLNEFRSMVDGKGNFPPNKLTIPSMQDNISTEGIPYNEPLRKDQILQFFGEKFQLCLEKGHEIHYIQKHEDGKEGVQLFSKSKVVCGTCISQFIQILYAVAIEPIVNPPATNIGIPVPVPIPVIEQRLPALTIPEEMPYIFDCQHFQLERILDGKFGSAKFREYIHLPTNRVVLCKVIENQNTQSFKQLINNECQLRNVFNAGNKNQVATFYGVGFNRRENAFWLAMENIGVSLYELDQYSISQNQPLCEELLAGVANVILNILTEGNYMYTPTFQLTSSVFFLNWKGELKLCDFQGLNFGSKIDQMIPLDQQFDQLSKNIDSWRSIMLRKLPELLTNLLHGNKGSKNLMDFIKDCQMGDLQWVKLSKLCKQYALPNKQFSLLELYQNFTKNSWYLIKEIKTMMLSIEQFYTDEKLIITKCDQLFLSFFELYSENIEVENEEELKQAVKTFYENVNNQWKVIPYLEHLHTKIAFAADDDFSMIDICQKSSGVFFFKKFLEKNPCQRLTFSHTGPIMDWPLLDNISEIEAALKIRTKNFTFLDEEYIPQIIFDHYKDEHWWWFPQRKRRNKKNST